MQILYCFKPQYGYVWQPSDDTTCTVFLNRCVHHIGLCALPGLKEVIWFPRPADNGDQSSTRDPDASFRTQQGTGLKVTQLFETFLCRGCEIFHVTCLYLTTCLQGYQVSLKSTRGPIDVFLCPEDSSGVCSPVTGSSPSKPNADPSLVPPTTQPTDQSQARTSTSTNAVEVSLSSPASTSSTVTAASQQDPSSLVLGGDSGECSHLRVNKYTFNGIPQSKQLGNNLSDTCPLKGKSCSSVSQFS